MLLTRDKLQILKGYMAAPQAIGHRIKLHDFEHQS